MSFPLSIFLLIYGGALLVYFGLSFFSLYHILRFGFMDGMTKFILTLYGVITLGILIGSGIYIAKVDWDEEVTLFELPQIDLSL